MKQAYVIIIMLLCGACGIMERDDIVGTWVYESGAGNAKSGRFVFRADGTFTAKTLPILSCFGLRRRKHHDERCWNLDNERDSLGA